MEDSSLQASPLVKFEQTNQLPAEVTSSGLSLWLKAYR